MGTNPADLCLIKFFNLKKPYSCSENQLRLLSNSKHFLCSSRNGFHLVLLGQQTPKLIPKTAYALSKNGKTSSVLGDKLGQRQPYNCPGSTATLQSPTGQRQPHNRPRSKATLQTSQVNGNLTIAPGQRQPYNRPR